MPSSEYLTPSFVGGWTALAAVAGVAGYRYYTKNRPAPKNKTSTTPYTAARKQNRAKKQRQEAFTSASQSAPADEEKPAEVAPAKADRDDNLDNRDFAQRMAGVREGKKFTGKSGDEKKRQKSVKQSHAVEKPDVGGTEEKPSAPSSTTGADADDDQSPISSPQQAPVDASGVSDMLEPAAPGPSVLRLTDTDKVKTKPKVTKAPEKVETKKQRQNRKKAEERKAMREEDEKERKVLMEKQRRGAREAAGIAAKDGSQFMAAVNGGKSAWNSGALNGNSNGKESKKEALDVQPLDTFESTPAHATAASVAPAASTKKAADDWLSSLPSEEEQMEMLKSEEDEWNTVTTKSSKKSKKSKPAEVPAAPAQEVRPAPQPITKPAPVNGKAAKPAQDFGSFSALSTKGGSNVEDEPEEQEWDV